MSNRLAKETSPYLLQHKDNPVDWYPWGEEALAKAKAENKPIFLSIGYAACHWCHVMEHESFEDEQIADVLNQHFVPIKVDREERPDLDQLYMNALQVYFQMIGSPQGGGWPLSMFLTPDLQPFLGGTYWPPRAMYQRPGFLDVLNTVARFWRENREQIDQQAARVTEYLVMSDPSQPGMRAPGEPLLRAAATALGQSFDPRHGGFGGAPKFPHPIDLQLLLRLHRRFPDQGLLPMVTLTLDKMAAGGIYDQLGGGFHRYAVDSHWLVPHFEKMLYDNAMLARCYLEAWQALKTPGYAQVVRETLDYVLREMTGPDGGFYSTQDADSEGEEGKFYVWTPDEIRRVLDPARAERFCQIYDITSEGNFEGKSILNLPRSIEQWAQTLNINAAQLRAELAEDRAKLLDVRSCRVWPGLDDKIIVCWNGLMIDAMAAAAGALDEPRYLEAATRAADFILDRLRREDGRLLHVWRQGRGRFDAYLDDYACLINGLVSLYEVSFEERYISAAIGLADQVMQHFSDPAQQNFFYTANDHERLIARQKDVQDNPVPSGNGMIATAFARLGKLTGKRHLLTAAESVIASFGGIMERAPTAAGQMLLALDFMMGPAHEIVLLAESSEQASEILLNLRQRFIPRKVLACRTPDGLPLPLLPGADCQESSCAALDPLFAGKTAAGDEPTVYICRDFACQQPQSGTAAITAAFDRLERGEE